MNRELIVEYAVKILNEHTEDINFTVKDAVFQSLTKNIPNYKITSDREFFELVNEVCAKFVDDKERERT
ncbi:TPA: hypothetical protein QCP80_003358 [Bacillus cereus]|nr:hypothetical protein [Bacillus cereus]